MGIEIMPIAGAAAFAPASLVDDHDPNEVRVQCYNNSHVTCSFITSPMCSIALIPWVAS